MDSPVPEARGTTQYQNRRRAKSIHALLLVGGAVARALTSRESKARRRAHVVGIKMGVLSRGCRAGSNEGVPPACNDQVGIILPVTEVLVSRSSASCGRSISVYRRRASLCATHPLAAIRNGLQQVPPGSVKVPTRVPTLHDRTAALLAPQFARTSPLTSWSRKVPHAQSVCTPN